MRSQSWRQAARGVMWAGLCLAAGGVQAALQDRDLNGDKVVDAFYDTDLDITWLRDADVNGLMHWDAAMRWACDFSFGGYADWRRPTSVPCQGWHCTASEMGHLWYVEPGNVPCTMTNKGGFLNLHSVAEHPCGSGTVDTTGPDRIWGFDMNYRGQGTGPRRADWYAMVVRDGDVTVVPEPSGGLLALLGRVALQARLRLPSRLRARGPGPRDPAPAAQAR